MQKLNRDGVALAYEERGDGGRPMLFVHGWCCDHTYFAPQVKHFSRNHRTISVDLRGHGASDKPDQTYAMEGFADDLAWMCAQLKIERPIVVGHSMGGLIAVQLTAQCPDLARAIIMVDAPLMQLAGPLPETEVRSRFQEALEGPDYREAATGFINRMFEPTDDSARRKTIIEQMTSTPRHVMSSAFQQVNAYNLAAAAKLCKVPVLYIQAARPRPGLDRLRELCPNLTTAQTAGSGHFNQLEVPEQVNAMIERFLAVSVKG